jgi:serine protease Do
LRLGFAAVVKRTAPAVVNIYSQRVVQARTAALPFDDPLFRRFFGDEFAFGMPRKRVENSLGSGVVVDGAGIIVTNHHVIAGGSDITVVLADKREFVASILGSDERTDLAALRIETGGERLPALEFRDSDEVEVGDLVLAIGNPFGVGQTVTSGIVSAQARTHVGISDLNFFIQTDAAINPGNSGGALVDVDGRLIGINTAIFSKTGGSLGIGFAVPSNMVRAVVAGFIGQGRVVRPWLGAWGRTVTADLAQGLGLKRPGGVVIEEVFPGGPADAAGLRPGDVVRAVNTQTVEDRESLAYRVATRTLGSTAELDVWRRGKELTVRVAMRPAPEDPPRDPAELTGRFPLAGLLVVNDSPSVAEELGAERSLPGVVVLGVQAGSPADRVGIKRGDRVLAVNGEKIPRVAALRRLASAPPPWRIAIGRGDRVLNVRIDG